MPRKKINLKELSVANGKIWDKEVSLAGTNPYGNVSFAEYQDKISKMPDFDLQKHAIELLIPIKGGRESIIKNLLKEYKFRLKE